MVDSERRAKPAIFGLAVEGYRTLSSARALFDGPLAVVCGPNNAGKSSLLGCFPAYAAAVRVTHRDRVRAFSLSDATRAKARVGAWVPIAEIGQLADTMSFHRIGELQASAVARWLQTYAGVSGLWVWFAFDVADGSMTLEPDSIRMDVQRCTAQLQGGSGADPQPSRDRELQRHLFGDRSDGPPTVERQEFWDAVVRTALPVVAVQQISDVRRIADRPLDKDALRKLVHSSVEHFGQRRESWTESIDGVLQDVFGSSVTYRAQPGAPEDEFWIQVDGEQRKLEQVGAGIREVVAVAYRALVEPERTVITIEEPENCLHPTAVRRLVQSLPQRCGCQLVVSTHSSAVVDAGPDSVIRVSRVGGESTVSAVVDARSKYQAAWDLGNRPSELVLTPCAIWVEGPSDRVYLASWLASRGLVEGSDYEIVFFGGSLGTHVTASSEGAADLVNLRSLSRRCALVTDSDRSSESGSLKPAVQRFQEEVEGDPDAEVWITHGREIENLLPIDVINSVRSRFGGSEMLPQNHRWGRVLSTEAFGGRRPPPKVAVALEALDLMDGNVPPEADELVNGLEEFVRASLA